MDSPAPTARTIRRLKFALMIILIGVLIAVSLREDFRSTLANELKNLPPTSLFMLVLLLVLMRIFQIFALKLSLSLTGTATRTSDCIQLAGLKGIYNLGFAGGGIAAQLAQATLALGISARSFLAATLLQSMHFLSSLLVVFSLFSLFSHSEIPVFAKSVSVAALMAAICLGLLVIACIDPRAPKLRVKALGFLETLYPKRPAPKRLYLSFWGLATCSMGIHFARASRLVLILGSLGLTAQASTLLSAVFASDLLAQVPLTPAGIGTRELALGYFGSSLDAFDLFILAAIIDRTATILFNIAHGILSLLTIRTHSRGT